MCSLVFDVYDCSNLHIPLCDEGAQKSLNQALMYELDPGKKRLLSGRSGRTDGEDIKRYWQSFGMMVILVLGVMKWDGDHPDVFTLLGRFHRIR